MSVTLRLRWLTVAVITALGLLALPSLSSAGTRDAAAVHLSRMRVVAAAAGPGPGFVLATAQGGVFSYAQLFHGSPRSSRVRLSASVVGISTTARGGYVEATANGGVYAFGTPWRGSPRAAGTRLRSRVVGIATTRAGGYLVATANGQVYPFGTRFLGSPRSRGTRVRTAIVGIAAVGSGGYVEVGADGAVYAFGTRFRGSPRTRGQRLGSRVVGIAATADGGYVVATANGGLHAFGTPFRGSARGARPRRTVRIVAVAGLVRGGYLLITATGGVYAFRAARVRRPGSGRLGAPRSGVGAGECAAPSASGPGLVLPGATGSAVGTLGVDLLKFLGETAGAWLEDYGLDEGLGWIMNLLGNGQPSVDPARIDQQFADVNSQLDNLANAQAQDCQAILDTLQAVKVNGDIDAYSNQAANMSTPITAVSSFQEQYDQIIAALVQNGGNVDQLGPTLKADLVAMLSGGQGGLSSLVDQINALESNEQPGALSLISFYSKLLMDQFGYTSTNNPFTTHIFPSSFVDASDAQQSYYAAIVTQAVYLYTNVAHLTFSYGGNTYTPDPSGIRQLVNRARTDIQGWGTRFADGPLGYSQNNDWVGQGTGQAIGLLPSGTDLDYRVASAPSLWTDGPVALNGDSTASGAPYYCATTVQYCYADRYDTAGKVGATALARPSASQLPALIAAQTPSASATGWQSLSGWRIPTSADWNALQAGVTGGLSAWGTLQQIGIFSSQPITSLYQGHGVPLTTIAPMLVNTGTSATPAYGVLSAPAATANALTLQQPPFSAPDGQNDAAGRLFLVQSFTPTLPPPLFTASSPLGTRAPVHKRRRHRTTPRPGLVSATQLPGPTTYSTPATCSQPGVYTVPSGAGSVQITAVGAGGATGQFSSGGLIRSAGGRGGSVTQTIPAVAGSKLYIQVGGAGTTGSGDDYDNFTEGGGAGGTAGGGNGAPTKAGNNFYGGDNVFSDAHSGGGGGASGVSTTANCSQWVVVGGGGGGGGAGYTDFSHAIYNYYYEGGNGGDGCALTGQSGCTGSQAGDNGNGRGGLAGAAGGFSPSNFGGYAAGNGATMQGGGGGEGHPGGGGGGGGGGYLGGGGGGGGGYNNGAGGGGGGTSFAIPGAAGRPSYGFGQPYSNGSVTITPIAKPPAPINLSASSLQVPWGQPPTLTATLPGDATGIVGFYDDVNGGCNGRTGSGSVCQGLGTATVLNGTAQLTSLTSVLSLGSHAIHASYLGNTTAYNGDAHYLPSTSAPVTVTVSKATPPATLAIQGTMVASGQAPQSLVVQLPADATGTVGFYNLTHPGSQDIGLGSAPVVNGTATLTTLTQTLADGTDQIRASYSGDAHYTTVNSNVVPVTVATTVGLGAPRPCTRHCTQRPPRCSGRCRGLG